LHKEVLLDTLLWIIKNSHLIKVKEKLPNWRNSHRGHHWINGSLLSLQPLHQVRPVGPWYQYSWSAKSMPWRPKGGSKLWTYLSIPYTNCCILTSTDDGFV
jgi:hypothetical protein